MRRIILTLALTTIGAGLVSAQIQIKPPATKPSPPRPAQLPAQPPPPPDTRIPDPSYRPTPGDQATVLIDNASAATSWLALDDFEKSRKVNDYIGTNKALKDESVFGLARGTKLLVIEDHEPKRTGKTFGSPEAAYRNLQNSVIRTRPYPVEVRVLDGPHAEARVFISKVEVGRLIEPAPPTMSGPIGPMAPPRRKVEHKKAPPPRVVPPADQAATSLQLGKNLRFEGKRDAAIGYFRKAIEQAPDSVAGKEAKGILKEMKAD